MLLLSIHQPAYRNGSQDHKENVTQGTIIEFWNPKACAGGLKGGKSPPMVANGLQRGLKEDLRPATIDISGRNENARESVPPDRDSQSFAVFAAYQVLTVKPRQG